MEEYILNWKTWVYKIAKITIDERDFLVANCIVLISGICLAMIGETNLTISLCFPMLMLINSIIHIISTIVFCIYSPGVITSIVVFIPLTLFILKEAVQKNRIRIEQLFIPFIIASIMMIYPVILQKIKMGKANIRNSK